MAAKRAAVSCLVAGSLLRLALELQRLLAVLLLELCVLALWRARGHLRLVV